MSRTVAYWLGQAGFLIEAMGLRVLVDPYLSDSLAVKYRGSATPHERLMPPPIAPGDLREIDLFCATHAHSDHLDPGTIPEVAVANPRCRFVVPKAERDVALARGVPAERLIAVSAGHTVDLGRGASLLALPAAHERLERDDEGCDRFLGYVFRFRDSSIYHSGDCVPYAGLAERLRELGIDMALLPVNGRDKDRLSMGILGNFTLEEALSLLVETGTPTAILHHFGMFAFNTIDAEKAGAALRSGGWRSDRVRLAECCIRYELREEERISAQSEGAPPLGAGST